MSIPECQWKRDWPHPPPIALPGSSRSCRPSHHLSQARSSAADQNTALIRPVIPGPLLDVFILAILGPESPIPAVLCPFPPPKLKPYMSVLRWCMQPGIVGRQAGTLARAWSTQRRYSSPSIYGTLLPGLATDIARISK